MTTATLTYLALALVIFLGARWLVHWTLLRGLAAPRLAHEVTPADVGLTAQNTQDICLAGPNGKSLFAWLVLPDTPGPHPAVLVMHGWGANASMMLQIAPPLRAAGYAVLFVDARCHGESDDERFTSMPRFAEDIGAGLAYLRTRPEIDPDDIALLGHSVGAGAVLLYAAHHDDIRAVISLSAFAHPREVMRAWLAQYHIPFTVIGSYILRHVERVIGARFDDIAPINTITQVKCPVLLVHGREDTSVAFNDALRLQAAQPAAQLLAVTGDHDLRETLRPHGDELVAFLDSACKPAQQQRVG
ncbi:alpha/beta hydrolase [Thioclava sp.]|uniref:alpha/beta hydrolase n=1 Tax=Thioclava sp. TaxID=1933450 RepID=UPI003AA864CC